MKSDVIIALHRNFEEFAHEADGQEYWLARELQGLLGYSQWRNFLEVINRGKTACKTAGHKVSDHFADARKMVGLGSGSEREVEDFVLSRYACYLIAQNGDPRKVEIAFAQTYFAVQTRKIELIEQRLEELERLNARQKLTQSEKELSGLINEFVGDTRGFALIRSKGDAALFGGLDTQAMKSKMGVPDSRALADFLPTITIKAKDFANEITNFNVKKNDRLRTTRAIGDEHVKNNKEVRKVLTQRGIKPEELPPEEDLKKVERRVQGEQKKLMKKPGG